jgi:AAA domain
MGLFTEAVRSEIPIKLCMGGNAGSGKTLSSLLLARGIVDTIEDPKIFLIDTEQKSSNLYANATEYGINFKFFYYNLDKYSVKDYTEACNAAVEEGANILIIDGISPAWAGEGGILDKKDKEEKVGASDRKGIFNWPKYNVIHDNFFKMIRNLPIHVICTVQGKTLYDLTNGVKKSQIMGYRQREDVDFKFDAFITIEKETSEAIVDKTRFACWPKFTNLGVITQDTGRQLYAWNSTGVNITTLAKSALDYVKEELSNNPNAMRLLLSQYKVTKVKDLPTDIINQLACKDFDLAPYIEKAKSIKNSLEDTSDDTTIQNNETEQER